ncbi:MAG: EF-hand domain-containing protein [Cyclobacteriaceae bacterium]
MLSEFQERKLTYFFSLLDENKNGVIQMEDFTEIAVNICENIGQPINSKYHRFLNSKSCYVFEKLLGDISPNGNVISLAEWLVFFDREIIESGDKERLNQYVNLIIGFLFDLFDENDDGYISIEEYTDMFLVYGIDIRFSAKSFVNMDLNGDNRLSKAEITKAIITFLISDDQSDKGNWVFGNWNMIQEMA